MSTVIPARMVSAVTGSKYYTCKNGISSYCSSKSTIPARMVSAVTVVASTIPARMVSAVAVVASLLYLQEWY